MKNFAYITLIFALIFGIQINEASANIGTITVDGPSTTLNRGTAKVTYDKERNELLVEMNTAGSVERVTVHVANSSGNIIAKEMLIVDGKGATTKISLDGQRAGVFQVKVSSNSIRLLDKINTK